MVNEITFSLRGANWLLRRLSYLIFVERSFVRGLTVYQFSMSFHEKISPTGIQSFVFLETSCLSLDSRILQGNGGIWNSWKCIFTNLCLWWDCCPWLSWKCQSCTNQNIHRDGQSWREGVPCSETGKFINYFYQCIKELFLISVCLFVLPGVLNFAKITSIYPNLN